MYQNWALRAVALSNGASVAKAKENKLRGRCVFWVVYTGH